jgi:integrase
MIKTQNFQRNGKKFLSNGIPVAIAWTTSVDRGLAAANPCARGGRLYRGSRAEKIWTDADEAMFLKRAPAHLHLALMLALWIGQRQGDLLRLPWSAYDGTHIRLRQPKGGVRVQIRVGAPLKAALDAAPRRCTIILTSATGKGPRRNNRIERKESGGG